MTTKNSVLQPITLTPGCQPNTDRTPFSTGLSTYSDKIRWYQGFPQKIGGWAKQAFDYGNTISGVARRMMQAYLSNEMSLITVIGTHLNLYALIGSTLTNITPLNTSTTTIASSLSTDYRTLGTDPATFVNGSGLITITDSSASQYTGGDQITLAGFSGTIRGIDSSLINGVQFIQSVGSGTYTISTTGTATSNGTGGGASVVVATGLITVAATAHGQTNGQRTKLASAIAVGGVTAPQINLEFIVRGAATDTFQVMTAGVATSSASAGGGSGTTYQTQISGGSKDNNAASGYGAGYYGIGLYGTAHISTSGRVPARIWCIDRFQDTFILCPDVQLGIYTWDGNTAVAPVLLTNAPTAVNYVFVSNNIIVTFGYQNVANQIFTSDISAPTVWTASQVNQVFQDTIAGAGALICHLSCPTTELLFCQNRIYTFTYVGLGATGGGLIWDISILDPIEGIVGPNAGCVVGGIAYWMGRKNFHMWSGGNVQIIPSSTQPISTMQNYVRNNLTDSQLSKCFVWYNEQFSEVWFHYPSSVSTECDRVARYNVNDQTWVPDTFDRSAAVSPNILTTNPILISSESVLYSHENGTDADGSAMTFTLTGNLLGGAGNWLTSQNFKTGGKLTTMVEAIVPDSIQTGDVTLTITSYQYPQSTTPTFTTSYTITPTTEIMAVQNAGRFRQYSVSGSAIGQKWISGVWQEQVQPGSMQ